VRVTDECGRISLNKVDEVTLKEVITNLVLGGNRSEGIDRRMEMQLDTVVDSIIDWRDVDDLKGAHGAETEYYMKRRNPHPAKNGYFDTPEELLKVRGVTPALFYGNGDCAPGLRDVFSVYCRKKSVNLHTAPAAVFQVLLGVDCDGAGELVAQRDAGAPLPIVQQGGPGSSGPFSDDPPQVVLIEARGDLTEKRNQSRVATVVQLESDVAEGVRVLRWFDRAPWIGGLPREDAGAGEAPS
jgi:hypothetical protein